MGVIQNRLVAVHDNGWTLELEGSTIMEPTYTGSGAKDNLKTSPPRFSSNNEMYAVVLGSSFIIYDMTGEIPLQIPTGITHYDTVLSVMFSGDDSRLMVADEDAVRIYSTADWSLLHNQPFTSTGYTYPYLSKDGKSVFVCRTSSPYYAMIHFVDGVEAGTIISLEQLSGKYPNPYGISGAVITNDGSQVVLFGDNIYFFNALNGDFVEEIEATDCKGSSSISPDGTTMVATMDTAFGLLDVATKAYSEIPVPGAYFRDAAWLNDDVIYFAGLVSPAIRYYTISTGMMTPVLYGTQFYKIALASSTTQYKVTGSISESLLVDNWRCAAYRLTDGTLTGITHTNTASFEILVPNADPVMVVVSPVPAARWRASKSYTIGTEVYPTNTSSIPFYYRCVGAGLSGATEPSWGSTSGGQTVDGGVTWEMIEGLAQPVAHMPLSPVPV